jgi:transposase, IS30 family
VIGKDFHHASLLFLKENLGSLVIKKMSCRTVDSVTLSALPAIPEHQANFKTLTLDNGTEFHDYKVLDDFPLKCDFAMLAIPGSVAATRT